MSATPIPTKPKNLGDPMNRNAQRNVYPYMRSNHPEVLAAWDTAVKEADEMIARAREWALGVSGQERFVYRGNVLEGIRVGGLPVNKVNTSVLSGRWKKPSNGAIRPYVINPANEVLDGLATKGADIPGRPSVFFGGFRYGTGSVFKWGGYLYSQMSVRDDMAEGRWDEDREIMAAYRWEELRGSQYLTALEELQASKGGE